MKWVTASNIHKTTTRQLFQFARFPSKTFIIVLPKFSCSSNEKCIFSVISCFLFIPACFTCLFYMSLRDYCFRILFELIAQKKRISIATMRKRTIWFYPLVYDMFRYHYFYVCSFDYECPIPV